MAFTAGYDCVQTSKWGLPFVLLVTKLPLDLFLSFSGRQHISQEAPMWTVISMVNDVLFFMSLSNFLEKTMGTEDCSFLEGKSVSNIALLI